MSPAQDSAPMPLDGPQLGDLQPGVIVDGFLLGERVHQGGMANLWSVTDLMRTDPDAAGPVRRSAVAPEGMPLLMKVPRIKGGEDPATIVGFEVEMMIMPTLKPPHAPQFVAKGDFAHLPYIVMERIEGPSLRARLDHAPLPIDEVIEIGSRVATALHELHRQHLVHLDVKPSNVVFRPDGVAAMVDFGLSRHGQLPDLLDEEFTLPMGTGPYMSPEQVQFVRNDPRSDQFALGVMLYHLTTGQRPFGHPDSVRGLRKRLYTEAVPPRTLRPECPAWLQEVILRCLEVKPENRYPSAAQLALDLQHPSHVALSARAERSTTAGGMTRFRRWFQAMGADPAAKAGGASGVVETIARNPIVMVAVDTDHGGEPLLAALMETTRRIVLHEPGARLACVSVMRIARIGMDELVDVEGRSKHVKQLVALKHWARPIRKELGLDEGRLTFHVLEASDVAAAIVDFAQRNQVDHVVMGARRLQAIRRMLGSVSAQVVAHSPCTVTVVRVPLDAGASAAANAATPPAATDVTPATGTVPFEGDPPGASD